MLKAHILWSASQVIHNPGHWNGVKCTGEVKKHNPHSARWLVQVGVHTVEQADNSILNSKSGLIGKLEEVQEWVDPVPEVIQDESLHDLHDVGGQCHRFVVLRDTWP